MVFINFKRASQLAQIALGTYQQPDFQLGSVLVLGGGAIKSGFKMGALILSFTHSTEVLYILLEMGCCTTCCSFHPWQEKTWAFVINVKQTAHRDVAVNIYGLIQNLWQCFHQLQQPLNWCQNASAVFGFLQFNGCRDFKMETNVGVWIIIPLGFLLSLSSSFCAFYVTLQ